MKRKERRLITCQPALSIERALTSPAISIQFITCQELLLMAARKISALTWQPPCNSWFYWRLTDIHHRVIHYRSRFDGECRKEPVEGQETQHSPGQFVNLKINEMCWPGERSVCYLIIGYKFLIPLDRNTPGNTGQVFSNCQVNPFFFGQLLDFYFIFQNYSKEKRKGRWN